MLGKLRVKLGFEVGQVIRIGEKVGYIRAWSVIALFLICDEKEKSRGTTVPPREPLVVIKT